MLKQIRKWGIVMFQRVITILIHCVLQPWPQCLTSVFCLLFVLSGRSTSLDAYWEDMGKHADTFQDGGFLTTCIHTPSAGQNYKSPSLLASKTRNFILQSSSLSDSGNQKSVCLFVIALTLYVRMQLANRKYYALKLMNSMT